MGPRTLQAKSSSETSGASHGATSVSAKALLANARKLLNDGEVYAAQRLAASASAKHPRDKRLRRLHELLNVGGTKHRPGTGRDIRQDLEWLRDPPEELRGMWIAVVGESVVASAATLREVMAQLPAHLEPQPLVLQIEA